MIPSRTLSALAFLHLAPLSTEASPSIHLVIEHQTLRNLPAELFGQFLERPSWNGEYGPEAVCDADGRLPAAVETALTELRAPLVRFPFGTAGDYIDWQDLIDLPGRAGRPTSTDHEGNSVSNRFGYPEYFDLARRMGWKTILVANLRDGLYNKKALPEAAAHAAALLDYGAKHAPRGSIAAFQIGNEGWFFWPPKPGEREALGVADLDAAALRLREALTAYADAARTVNPAIPLICDAPRPDDGGGLENDSGRVWRKAVDHPSIRSRYQFLAAHAYAPMGLWTTTRGGRNLDPKSLTEDEVWFGLVASLGRFDAAGQNVADARAYDEIRTLGFQTAVTEWNWNGWDLHKRFPQAAFRDGLPAALGSAGFLHGMMRHPHVALATQSMMLGTQWGITSVRVLPGGKVIHGPQAEAVRLYAERHGTRVLASTLVDVPTVSKPPSLTSWWPGVERIALIDAVVTANDDRLFLHLINRSRTKEIPLSVQLPAGRTPSGAGRITTLTADDQTLTTMGGGRMKRKTREIPFPSVDRVLVLPAASISVVEIPLTPVDG